MKKKYVHLLPKLTCGKVMAKAFKRRGFKFIKGCWVRVRNEILIRFMPHEWKSKCGGRFYYAYTLEKRPDGYPPCINDTDKVSTVEHVDGWIEFSQVR